MGGRTKGGLKRNKNNILSLNTPTVKKQKKKHVLVVGRQARAAKKKNLRIVEATLFLQEFVTIFLFLCICVVQSICYVKKNLKKQKSKKNIIKNFDWICAVVVAIAITPSAILGYKEVRYENNPENWAPQNNPDNASSENSVPSERQDENYEDKKILTDEILEGINEIVKKLPPESRYQGYFEIIKRQFAVNLAQDNIDALTLVVGYIDEICLELQEKNNLSPVTHVFITRQNEVQLDGFFTEDLEEASQIEILEQFSKDIVYMKTLFAISPPEQLEVFHVSAILELILELLPESWGYYIPCLASIIIYIKKRRKKIKAKK